MAGSAVLNRQSNNESSLMGLNYNMTADGSGNFPNVVSPPNEPVWLLSICVKFDGTTPPNSLIIRVNDVNGVNKIADITFSAGGQATLDPPIVAFPFGFSLVHSGNTTANAKYELILATLRG